MNIDWSVIAAVVGAAIAALAILSEKFPERRAWHIGGLGVLIMSVGVLTL